MRLNFLNVRYELADLKRQGSKPSAFEELTARRYGKDSFCHAIASFAADFVDDKAEIQVKTSGSTGTPKTQTVLKNAMKNSALKTLKFLDLRPGDNALLCLPVNFIAGKMMVVRALYGGLNLIPVTPCKNPYQDLNEEICFSAITPMQAMLTLQDETSARRMFKVKHTIIGGGPVPASLEQGLQQASGHFYSSYGMTETLSHIALRSLNGKDKSDLYTLLDNISISKSDQDTLIIYAPDLAQAKLCTNDIVQIQDDRHFKVLGRLDNVINSGGIKIQIEEVERKLEPYLQGEYAISCLNSEIYGQEVCLVLTRQQDQVRLKQALTALSKYEKPKHIIKLDKLPRTSTQKIARKQLASILNQKHAQFSARD